MSKSEIKKLDQVIEIILRMLPKERESEKVYRQAAKIAPSDMSRLLFERLADQEKIHEKKLRAALDLLEAEKEELSES